MAFYSFDRRIINPSIKPWGYSFAPLWTPADITTALWLDAADSDTVTLVSGAVSEWADKSGNNRHATQGTAGNRPTYVSNGINSSGTIRFNGTSSYLSHSVIQSNPSLLSVYIVANAGTSQNGSLWSHRSEDTRLLLLRSLSGTNGTSALARGSSNVIQTITSTKSSGSPRVYGMEFDRTNKNFEIIVDGTSGDTSTYDFGTQTLTSTKNLIGAQEYSTIDNWIDGDISEIVITTANYSQKLEGYLAHKYGLSGNLPSDHPYKTRAPRA